jgi:hypothetical protein
MALTVTDVVTEFGSYFRNEGQGVKDILKTYYQPGVTHSYFNPVPTTNTQERRTKFLKSRTLQRYQKAFTPIGGGEFKPCSIDLAWMKIDEKEVPGELEQTWLGFLNSLDSNDRRNWPFVKWWVTQVLNQAEHDFELNEIYFGAEGAIVPGTATAAGASMDGLEVQMNDGVTANEITPIDGPAAWSLDPEEFVNEIETWLKDIEAVSNEHRLIMENDIDYIFMQTSMAKRYAEGLRKKYQVALDLTQMSLAGEKTMPLMVADRNCKIVGLPSMTGTDRVWTTPKENRAGFTRKPAMASVLGVEQEDRSVKLFGDVWKGAGFWYKPYVFMTQHDL